MGGANYDYEVILMVEIEGFDTIISSLSLAKELHDINRYDVVEQQFFDSLCWDSYFQNILGVISSVFVGFESDYDDDDETEMMWFSDDVISNFFIYAWEYGQIHNLHYSENPYVTEAQCEAQRWLNSSCCVAWKLLAYIRTKKSAKQSKLLIRVYNGCGSCDAHGNLAYGLIQLYTWFTNKCAELEALKVTPNNPKENAPVIHVKSEYKEAMAA